MYTVKKEARSSIPFPFKNESQHLGFLVLLNVFNLSGHSALQTRKLDS
jgi:hypothetical protein